MKKYFLLVLLLSLCFTQRGEKWKNRFKNDFNKGNRDRLEMQKISDEAKILFYQTEKLSPEKAALYQFALPVPFINLGYAYSDSWNKSLKWDIVLLACIIKGNDIDWGEYDYYEEEKPNEDLGENLKIAVAGITLLKMFDAYQSAEKYNNQLFKRVFKRKRPSFSFNYSKDSKLRELTMSYPIN
ncbi:hypothetical protein OAH62_01360 [Candidatus Marinimicrobia bacterium]|jgi:hypothetical protein|nr:hypothetical protein [Candidatus Neomarinimicrobiota bacterium]